MVSDNCNKYPTYGSIPSIKQYQAWVNLKLMVT